VNLRLFPESFPPAEPVPAGTWRSALGAAFGLAFLLLVLYWPAVDFKLLSFDDMYYTRDNELIARGLDGGNIARAFTRLPEENLFIPMTHLSLMTDVSVFGMSSRGFHLTNILIFAIDSALLLLLLWRMTGALGRSVFAAALVALHPLRVESAVWVTERKGVLSVFFLLLTVACHMKYARTGKRGWYAALLACAILGLLTKPVLVTLPVLLLLLDYWPLGRFGNTEGGGGAVYSRMKFRALAVEKLPIAVVALAASLFTLKLQSAVSLHRGVSMISRLEHAFASVFVYLFQTVWPTDLSFRFFETPWAQLSGSLLPSAAGIVLFVAIGVRYAAKKPWLSFGMAWFLVALLPNSGIIPSGVQWISDRFTWIPHFGLAVAFAWLANDLLPRRPVFLRPVLAGLLLVALVFLTRSQLYAWKDGATLFGRGVVHDAGDPRYVDQYVAELVFVGDLAKAREVAERNLRFSADPEVGEKIQANYLSILDRLGDRKILISAATEFLRQTPGFHRTRMQLADALSAEGRFGEATEEYRQVAELPGLKAYERGYALEGMGISLFRAGKTVESLAAFEEGLRTHPSSASLHFNEARLLAATGKAGDARTHFEEALRLAPGDLRIRMALAELLVQGGIVEEALFLLGEVTRMAPGTAEAYLAQARILESSGMTSEARSRLEQALAARPVLPETHDAVRRRLAIKP
jgi:protein O-mannosyl-transferase